MLQGDIAFLSKRVVSLSRGAPSPGFSVCLEGTGSAFVAQGIFRSVSSGGPTTLASLYHQVIRTVSASSLTLPLYSFLALSAEGKIA